MTTSEARLEKVLDAISGVKLPVDFTIKELTQALKDLDCPYANLVPGALRKIGIIESSEFGCNNFVASDWDEKALGILLDEIASSTHVKKVTFQSNKGIEIQEAINLLKSKGYKILEPIVEYVEL